MPIKSISSTHIINVDTIINTPLTPPLITGPNDVILGSWSLINAAPQNSILADFAISGHIDVDFFPRIPASAIITKIEVSGSYSQIATATVTSGDASTNASLDILITLFSLSNIVVDVSDTDITPLVSSVSLVNSYNTTIFNDPTGAQNKSASDLMGTFELTILAGGGGPGSNTFNWDFSNSAFAVSITWNGDNYSWYIKPTETIVNGQSVKIIDDPTEDIIAILYGDVIPEGYVLYGTVNTFPDIIYYWWASTDFYLFYIYSPISPNAGIIDTWINIGVTPPICTDCLSLMLGSNSVLVANASGVYTLDSSTFNDTLYVRTTPVTEIEVKIPNPFVKIGLVP